MIIQGDCLERLQDVDAQSVDLVFADPPFNIGHEYDEYSDKRSRRNYLDWSHKWIWAIKHVLKPTGTLWITSGDEYAAELKVLATRMFKLICRNWVIWYYTFGNHCKMKFTRSHMHLFYFVKNAKNFTFNDMAIRVPSARQLIYKDKRANPDGRVPDDTWILRPQDVPADGDTWYFPRVCGTFKERTGFHGCQMPEQLLGRIIKACSNEGDLILDPFAGSGTTLAVAKKLNRRYFGIELSKTYVKGARKRLKGITVGDPLHGKKGKRDAR